VENLENEVILDTDVIIDFLKRTPEPAAIKIFRKIKAGKLTAHMTSITVFELYRGARLSPNPQKSIEDIKTLQWYINVLPFDEASAEKASEICVHLEKRGEPIEIRDLFISAIAKTRNTPLLTGNITHFQRIPGLKLLTSEKI
jgi:predicted nucleic acid-binding protein